MKINRLLFFFTLTLIFPILDGKSLFLEEKNCIQINRKTKKTIHCKRAKTIQLKEDFLAVHPKQIAYRNNSFYIFDNQLPGILVYSDTGKFIKEYIKQGNGPGELINPIDFSLTDNYIYCLDQVKLSVIKFDLNLKFIWERKIPSQFTELSIPFHISANDDKIVISSVVYYNSLSLIAIFDDDMKPLGSSLKYINEIAKGKNNNSTIYKYIIATYNSIALYNNELYVSMATDENMLYKVDLSKNRVIFKVIDKTISNKLKKINIESKEVAEELVSFFNTWDIQATKDFIVILEETGGNTTNSDEIVLPDEYYNNLSFYDKLGNYLFSFEDKSIPYNYIGLIYYIEQVGEELFIYILDNNKPVIYTYKIKANELLGSKLSTNGTQ